MAASKNTDEVARGADVALKLSQGGPRDALVDPLPGDYVPDLDSKGLHVGEVRQPAEPVLNRAGDVTFESVGDAGESKFAPTTYAEQVAANSAWEKGKSEYAGVEHRPIATAPADVEAAVRAARNAPAPRRASTARATGSGAGTALEADANAVAGAQAAEDNS